MPPHSTSVAFAGLAAPDAVSAILQAFVGGDGLRLVMRAGDVPFVVTPLGRVSFPAHPLTRASILEIIEAMIPIAIRRALDDIGCVHYEIPWRADLGDARLVMIATTTADDTRVEFQRASTPDDGVAADMFGAWAPAATRP